MRRTLVWIIFLFYLPGLIFAQSQHTENFDSLIDVSISLSEQALFNANFEEAERYINVSHFREFTFFEGKHELRLTLQLLRIQGFKRILYRQNTNQDKTLAILQELSPIARNVKDKNILGDYFTLLSSAYQSTGKKDSASHYNHQALALYQEAGNIKKVAQIRGSQISRRHLGLQAAGETEKVLQLIPDYENEIEFAIQCDNKYVSAYNTRHLAQIHLRQTANYTEAMRLFQTSLELRKEIGFKLFLPASYSSIGDVTYKLGQDGKAIEMYLKSIELAEEIGFVRYQFYPRIKLGDIYQRQGNYEGAKRLFIEALKAASASNYEAGINEALQALENLIK